MLYNLQNPTYLLPHWGLLTIIWSRLDRGYYPYYINKENEVKSRQTIGHLPNKWWSWEHNSDFLTQSQCFFLCNHGANKTCPIKGYVLFVSLVPSVNFTLKVQMQWLLCSMCHNTQEISFRNCVWEILK